MAKENPYEKWMADYKTAGSIYLDAHGTFLFLHSLLVRMTSSRS